MPECAKATCNDRGAYLIRYGDDGDKRVYCPEHYRELEDFEYLDIRVVRRL